MLQATPLYKTMFYYTGDKWCSPPTCSTSGMLGLMKSADSACCHVVRYITSYDGHKYSLGTRVRLQHKADSRNCLLSGFLSVKGLPPQPSAPYLGALILALAWCKRTQAALPCRAVGWEIHQLLRLPAWADKAGRSSKESSVGMSPWMINILPKEKKE